MNDSIAQRRRDRQRDVFLLALGRAAVAGESEHQVTQPRDAFRRCGKTFV